MNQNTQKSGGMLHVVSKDYVKQSNNMVELQLSESTVDTKRIIAYLISTIPENQVFSLETFFRAPATDFFKKLSEGIGGKFSKSWVNKLQARAKEAVAEIVKTRIVQNLSKDKDQKDGQKSIHIINIAIIPYCELIYTNNKQEFVYQFHPFLKDFLLHLKDKFTTYKLTEYISLPTVYAMKIYEMLARYKDTNERFDSIDNLKMLLGCVGKYKTTRDFLLNVIDSCQKALSETSLAFTYKTIKGQGKKITGIHFTILQSITPPNKISGVKKNPFEDYSFWKTSSKEKRENIIKIWRFGVSPKMIIKNIELLSEQTISELAVSFYKLQTKKEIKSFAAYRTKLFKVEIEKAQLKFMEKELDEEVTVTKAVEIHPEKHNNSSFDIKVVLHHINTVLKGIAGTQEMSNKVIHLCLDDTKLVAEIMKCENIESIQKFIEKHS